MEATEESPSAQLNAENSALAAELATLGAQIDEVKAAHIKVDLLISLVLSGPFREFYDHQLAMHFNGMLKAALEEAKRPKLLVPEHG